MTTIRSGAGASVRTEALSKSYGEVQAVADLTVDFAASEFITLLGPSGSGKTTTLMMIAGFEIPTSGEILINDTPVGARAPRDRNLGMVFQNYALFPHMTVYDNVAFPLKMRNRPKDEIRKAVGEALEVVNLVGYDRRYPRQLSGGQQQRVAFARAIVFRPPVLLMDEPLGALDKNLRQRLQLEVKRIQRDLGVTVIYVTHDQEEALLMSDRIFLMNHGKVEQSGSPDDLYNRPRTEFVAGFLGETNFLPAEIPPGSGLVEARIGGVTIRAPAVAGLTAKSAGKLAIRPEKLWLSGAEDPDPAVNSVPVTVEDALFAGDHHRVGVTLDSRERVVVRQNARFGAATPEPGSRRFLSWHADDGRLLAGDA